MRATPPHPKRIVIALLAFQAALFISLRANAYAWMIRHEYTGCAVCHVDPSGSGLLTEYGRAASYFALQTQYGQASEEVPKSTGFLWGSVPLPEWFLASGSARAMALATKPPDENARFRAFPMQADLRAGVRAGAFRASASLGYGNATTALAQVTPFENANLISREHWLGWSFFEDAMLVRAGRMNLPFGIRQPEHTLWIRSTTRTDTNISQQHGVALAYGTDKVRTEVMAIAGNYQINPDAYRERGYSSYLEWFPTSGHALGLSSQVTTTLLDIERRTTGLRQSHGLFARIVPFGFKPIVLLGEADILLRSPAGSGTEAAFAEMLQVDYEPKQGFHAMGTLELLQDRETSDSNVGGWLSFQWFFLPHADIRIDGIVRQESNATTVTALSQLHVFL